MTGKSETRRSGRWVVLGLVLGGLAVAPGLVRGADHRDSPTTKTNGQLDINDVYAFQSPSNPSHSVIIVTVVPLAGVFNLPLFSSTGLYDINVDNNGDAVEDVTFRFAFSAPNRLGVQKVAVQMIKNHVTTLIGQDLTGNMFAGAQGTTIEASLFDDPFFFDLNAFNRFKISHSPNEFCGKGAFPAMDFFKGLNTMAMVIDVPNSLLLAANQNPNIGIWARTLDATGKQFDRMGRPAVNTALIPDAMKDMFNAGIPSTDRTNWTNTVVATLMFDGNGSSSAAIAAVLLPDILTYNTSSDSGFLNGRQLLDDVIDAEFSIFLVNFPAGSITTDCIGNDSVFLPHFPYLGVPNPVAVSP